MHNVAQIGLKLHKVAQIHIGQPEKLTHSEKQSQEWPKSEGGQVEIEAILTIITFDVKLLLFCGVFLPIVAHDFYVKATPCP